MSLTGGLRTWLMANVTGLSASNTFVGHAPQDATEPHIVINRDSESPYNALDGAGDLIAAEVTIDCKDTNTADAAALAKLIKDELEPHSGTAGDVTVEAVILNDTFDSVEPATSGQDYQRYITTLDFTIQYRES